MRFNKHTQMYELKFHMTVLRSQGQRPFDATELLAAFGNTHLGKVKLKEVHVSSRADYEAPDGQRMARELF